MLYDVTYTDNGKTYEVAVHGLTMREDWAVEALALEMSKRDDTNPAQFLEVMQKYPLLKFATNILAINGLPVEVTEDAFADCPKLFVLEWYEAALEKNPHRNTTYEQLIKSLKAIGVNLSNNTSTPSEVVEVSKS